MWRSTLFIVHLQDGFTPIDVAVQQGHEKVVAALLHHDSRVRTFLITFITFYLILNVRTLWYFERCRFYVFNNLILSLIVKFVFITLGKESESVSIIHGTVFNTFFDFGRFLHHTEFARI